MRRWNRADTLWLLAAAGLMAATLSLLLFSGSR